MTCAAMAACGRGWRSGGRGREAGDSFEIESGSYMVGDDGKAESLFFESVHFIFNGFPPSYVFLEE